MLTYLVTGCHGFIGSNLTAHLLSAGHRVVGLDNGASGLRSNIQAFEHHPNFRHINGDIRDITTCHDACNGVDYVMHEAALGSVPESMAEPMLYHDNNVTGTLNMLIAARDAHVKRFVYASSSAIYGDSPELPKTELLLPAPKSPYAISKITAEYYAKVFNEAYGLHTIGLRYFNVFGPRQNPNSQYAAVIPKFITAYLNNTAPTIFGDGDQTRDFTYIDRVINANLKACLAPESACGSAYNVGSGVRLSLNELVHVIRELIGNPIDPIYLPERPGDIRDSVASAELAQRHLNLAADIPLHQALTYTIDWYRGLEPPTA